MLAHVTEWERQNSEIHLPSAELEINNNNNYYYYYYYYY